MIDSTIERELQEYTRDDWSREAHKRKSVRGPSRMEYVE